MAAVQQYQQSPQHIFHFEDTLLDVKLHIVCFITSFYKYVNCLNLQEKQQNNLSDLLQHSVLHAAMEGICIGRITFRCILSESYHQKRDKMCFKILKTWNIFQNLLCHKSEVMRVALYVIDLELECKQERFTHFEDVYPYLSCLTEICRWCSGILSLTES